MKSYTALTDEIVERGGQAINADIIANRKAKMNVHQTAGIWNAFMWVLRAT